MRNGGLREMGALEPQATAQASSGGASPPGATGWRATDSQHMNPVREPDAGKPHVRFDERRPETEPWNRLRHQHKAKAVGNSYFLSLPPPRRSSTLRAPRGTTPLSSAEEERLVLTDAPSSQRCSKIRHLLLTSVCGNLGCM